MQAVANCRPLVVKKMARYGSDFSNPSFADVETVRLTVTWVTPSRLRQITTRLRRLRDQARR